MEPDSVPTDVVVGLDPTLTLIVLVLLFLVVFMIESRTRLRKGEVRGEGLAKQFFQLIADAITKRGRK